MSLRSEAAQHFGNLERMQGGGVAVPTPGPTGTPTPDYTPRDKAGLKDAIITLSRQATSEAQFQHLLDVIYNYGQAGDLTSSTYEYLRKALNNQYALRLSTNRSASGGTLAPPHELVPTVLQKRPSAGTTGGKGNLIENFLSNITKTGTTLLDTLKGAGEQPVDFGLGDLGSILSGGGDSYHSPEWRPGELELSQQAQAETEKTNRATLAQNMGQLEQAEQESRRTALLEAAQALFTAAGTAAPPGMTTYPGYEEGGVADILAKIGGTTVPASLQAPITRKPVSFDVLDALDLGPLKEQIAAIMGGVATGKKGLVTMAGGGATIDLQNLARALQGKSPEEQTQIINWVTTSGAVSAADAADILKWVNTSSGGGSAGAAGANSVDAILGQALYELQLQHEADLARLQGVEIPTMENQLAQIMGYTAEGDPTMDMRSRLAETKSNPRNIIEGLFLGRGMGLPASLSNVEAMEGDYTIPSGGGGGGTTSDPLQGAKDAADLAARQARNPDRWQAPSGAWWQSQGDYDRQQTRNVESRKRQDDTMTKARKGDFSGLEEMSRLLRRSASGKVVSGPAISTVGERGGDAGTEYAFLPPGSVVAPKPPGEKPSMDGALRAIAAQLFKSGLGGKPAPARMAEGGSVFSPTVTGSLPRALLDAPALKAFMYPTNEGLSSVHKMPALFQPFGEGGPEAPNWLDPRAILAYSHADPTERGTMESLTSAFGWDPATALEMARRAMAGFGKPVGGEASYRPYWRW